MTEFFKYLSSTAGDVTATEPNAMASLLSLGVPIILMIVVFYFFMIRPERKRSKQTKDMLENIQVGDEIITSGGIIGRVISVKEDTVLMETGSDRTKIRIMKNAIVKSNTIHDESAG